MTDSTQPPTEPAAEPAGAEARIEPGPDHAEEAQAEALDDVTPGAGYAMLPMIGLGGSAGAIPALQAFLAAMPADTGMVFVVVMHLAADHESTLASILQRATSMPVRQVAESARVAANHVYVIPPAKSIQSANGHLHCVDLHPSIGRRVAVDLFFRSLADTHGPRATAVVLSGADGDGAIGLKRIKERGGLTIAQDPDEAEFDSMPRSAIATGMVDWVLPVAAMAVRIASYHALLPRLKLPSENGPPIARLRADGEVDQEGTLRELLAYVRVQTGRDFVNYKRQTVLRRIARRMSVNGIEALEAYLGFMRTHPGEAGALLKDLLISVTNFFRDRTTFDALEAQVPALFEGKGPEDVVRVWVAACATGEEAYSIGMLLAEHARTLPDAPSFQIFATDTDEDAIRAARDGLYPHAITADVSEERLRRFFTREPRGYRVRPDLRETVLFAAHDLLVDSPFSRLDLISCRNVLIYLNREAQARALETFHFALHSGGLLFLGSSEAADTDAPLFSPLDAKSRLYRARVLPRKSLPAPAGQSSLTRALELHQRTSAQPPVPVPPGTVQRQPLTSWLRASPSEAGVRSWRELHWEMLVRMAPPSLVASAENEIVHLTEQAGRFLHFAGGEPTSSLLSAVHPALAIDLRTALSRARENGHPADTTPVPFVEGEQRMLVTMRVAPADAIAPGYHLVSFESRPADAKVAEVQPGTGDKDQLTRMARQIDELKRHLRHVTQSNDLATQELKANNEELQAINEELRSATEELETSREELQSINEELSTVNVELKRNVDDLGHSNTHLQNLMAATAIATVFLDRELRITLFTPPAVELFHLIPSDVGRPLSDLAHHLEYPQMGDDARQVLDALVPVEREVGLGIKAFLVRVLPYRGAEDKIAGVVFSFLDITAIKRSEESLRESELLLRTIVGQAAAGVARLDLDGKLTFVNPHYCEITGRTEAELIGRHAIEFVHPDDRDKDRVAFRRLVALGEPFEMEKRYLHPDGSVVLTNAAVTATYDAQGRRAGVVAILLDITRRGQADRALRESEERMRLLIESAREFAIVGMDLERRVTSWNVGAERLLGYTEADILGRPADVIFTAEDRAAGAPEYEAATALREGRAADERWHVRRDGTRFWGSGAMMSMRGDDGAPVGLLKIFRDQSAVRMAQEALELSRADLVEALVDNRHARAEAEQAMAAKDRFLAILSHELRTPMTPVVMALHALERSVDLPPSARGTLDLIRRNVKAELRLIDDLLDVTRISSGKLELSNETCDLHDVVRAAADVCEADFAAKRQSLRVTLGARNHTVRGDPQRLQQVLWNLLKNASKFTPVEGAIRVETSNAERSVLVAVSDTGIGIEPEALPTIFEAFQQEGPWVTTEFGGLGLGLAIAKAAVEAHRGALKVTSAGRNRGTTFTVELPTE